MIIATFPTELIVRKDSEGELRLDLKEEGNYVADIDVYLYKVDLDKLIEDLQNFKREQINELSTENAQYENKPSS